MLILPGIRGPVLGCCVWVIEDRGLCGDGIGIVVPGPLEPETLFFNRKSKSEGLRGRGTGDPYILFFLLA
jgi:hypothetical protein